MGGCRKLELRSLESARSAGDVQEVEDVQIVSSRRIRMSKGVHRGNSTGSMVTGRVLKKLRSSFEDVSEVGKTGGRLVEGGCELDQRVGEVVESGCGIRLRVDVVEERMQLN